MTRSSTFSVSRGRSFLLVLILTSGCAHSTTDLRDSLEQRIKPVEGDAARPTSQPQSSASDPPPKDAKVQPTVVSQPLPANAVNKQEAQSTPLPAALDRASLPPNSDRPSTPAMPLPKDSDEASLDEIAATGKPLTLPEAVKLAFRYQPRLHAQVESVAQARGAQQIVFSTFLPMVAANYGVGEYSLGVGGQPISVAKGLPGFNFTPGLGALPIGFNAGTNFELAELKVQWLLLDFGRRLGRYEQARLANDVAQLQTDRAYQTVANDVAVAYYNVLRSQALRRTAQDALRRADEELEDARKHEREGVVEREVVLRSEVQRAENLQELHASTGTEFVALAGLNLAIGLKCNQPVRVADSPEIPPLTVSLAECLQTAIRERREFYVIQRTVEIAVQGGRVARADFAPKVIADGTLLNFQQQYLNGHADLRLGFIRLDWTLFEGGRRIAATRVADSQVRQAMAQAESITDNIAFQVNEAYRGAVTAWVGIDDARPAVDQASENLRLVKLRLAEGAATPTEIADAQASLTRAQQNFLNSRYNYLIARDRLEYAMGVSRTPMYQNSQHS
jgi:outer membrane protein